MQNSHNNPNYHPKAERECDDVQYFVVFKGLVCLWESTSSWILAAFVPKLVAERPVLLLSLLEQPPYGLKLAEKGLARLLPLIN